MFVHISRFQVSKLFTAKKKNRIFKTIKKTIDICVKIKYLCALRLVD